MAEEQTLETPSTETPVVEAPVTEAPTKPSEPAAPVSRGDAIRQAIETQKAKSAAPAEKDVSGPTRAPNGKFAPKAPPAGGVMGQQPAAAAPVPAAAPAPAKRPMPKSWKADKQALWDAMHPDAQAYAETRETDILKGIAGYKQQLDQVAPAWNTIQPYVEGLTRAHGSVEKGLDYLFKLSDFAGRDPVGFVQWFAQQRGISLDGQTPAQHPQPQIHPQAMAEINALRHELTELKRQTSQAMTAPYIAEVEKIRSDPAYPHFEELRPVMAALIESGQVEDIRSAYQQAVWSRADFRDAELARQREDALKAEKERVDKARQGAVQVRPGAPAPAAASKVDPSDRRAVIANAMSSLGRT